jgi:UDP:flavonoid glycosyltransferase YjiC (YdhE family)
VLAVTRAYQVHVEAAGLECRPIRPEGDPSDRAIVSRIMDPMRGPEYLIRRVMMPNLRDMYDDLADAVRDVDVVVSHPLTFAAPVLCEKKQIPWAASVLAPLSFFSHADPPLAIPGPISALVHDRWPRVAAAVTSAGVVLTRSWTRPVQRLRASLGLPRGKNPVTAGQFSPHLNLALFSRALASPQPDWPPETVVTGAVRFDAVHGAMEADLEDFLQAGPPPVVFTLGSSAVVANRAAHFYDVSAAAVAALGIRAVLLIGHLPENRPMAISRDLFVTAWAPHSELFHRAAAIVHQGGAGTLHTALAAGRPMLVVPFAHDQPDNAARVARLGVARVLYPNQYTAVRVQQALEILLRHPAYAQHAAAVKTIVDSEDGATTAASALTRLEPGRYGSI